MKKVLTLLLCTCFAALSFADIETVNGIKWEYTVSKGGAKIYNSLNDNGLGYPAIPETTAGAITIPSALGGYPVTSIGRYAFLGCSSLTSVTIPEGVTSIGDDVFCGCRSLTSVTIPSSVTSIGNSAFPGCSSLTSVTIPSSVTSIGDDAFRSCYSLPQDENGVQYESEAKVVLIDVPESMTGSFIIPNSVRLIHSSAFEDCSGLTSVTIPSSVTSIGWGAFSDCSSLTSVTIPEGVTEIGSLAFYNCSSLTSVVIPSSVKSIGDGAFLSCSNLKIMVDVKNPSYTSENGALFDKEMKKLIRGPGATSHYTIPSSVTEISSLAFYNCSSLTSVVIPSSVTSIGEDVFRGCSSLPQDENGVQYESEAKVVLIKVPESMTGSFIIPNSVRLIHSSAFLGCSSLTSVTIPSSVTSIGNYAFYRCTGLTSVTISEGVKSIGDYAFSNCSSLTSVTIPEGVTEIGSGAFMNCGSLTSVIFEGVPPTVESYAFSDVASGCKGYYPSTKASAWEAVISNGTWNGLTMEMVEIPTFAVNETVVGDGEVSVEIAPKAGEKAGF